MTHLERYTQYWTAQRSNPPSIRPLEAVFSLCAKHSWRPDENTPYVDHHLTNQSRMAYEEIIPDCNRESLAEITEALKSEIRH